MNLFTAINSAIDIALETDDTYFIMFISEQKFLERTLNLAVFLDAQVGLYKNMVCKGFSILHFRNRESQHLELAWQ